MVKHHYILVKVKSKGMILAPVCSMYVLNWSAVTKAVTDGSDGCTASFLVEDSSFWSITTSTLEAVAGVTQNGETVI